MVNYCNQAPGGDAMGLMDFLTCAQNNYLHWHGWRDASNIHRRAFVKQNSPPDQCKRLSIPCYSIHQQSNHIHPECELFLQDSKHAMTTLPCFSSFFDHCHPSISQVGSFRFCPRSERSVGSVGDCSSFLSTSVRRPGRQTASPPTPISTGSSREKIQVDSASLASSQASSKKIDSRSKQTLSCTSSSHTHTKERRKNDDVLDLVTTTIWWMVLYTTIRDGTAHPWIREKPQEE